MTFSLPTSSPITHRTERGAVAAEFALLIPVLLLLVFGMIQLGLTYQRQEAVNAAAREAARIASLPTSTDSNACDRSTDSLDGVGFTGTPNCVVTGNCGSGSGPATDFVEVVITVDNDIEIPFYGTPTITLTGKGNFRCE